jgi:hypothetical protein
MRGIPMPDNVRVLMPDGTQVPIELRYRGPDDLGVHIWEQVSPGPFPKSIFADQNRVLFDDLPGMCGISIEIDDDL